MTKREGRHATARTLTGYGCSGIRIEMCIRDRPKRVPDDFGRVRELWRAGEISAREAARRLGVSRSTFEKWANSAAA